MADLSTSVKREKVIPPGPGNYELPCFPSDIPVSGITTGAKFSMGCARKDPAPRKDSADPGKYHPNVEVVQERSPTYRFGSQQRMAAEQKVSKVGACVGQGDNINYYASPAYGFGSSERDKNPP